MKNPEPFTPGKIESVSFDLNEVAHCFKKDIGSWCRCKAAGFPLVDRNPQKFVKIPGASENDFQAATIRIYFDAT